MAHFAKVENGIVTDVHVVVNEVLDNNGEFPESEPSGKAFLASLGLGDNWYQTSYNANFRFNYAGQGYTYDSERDAFIPPKPSEDAVLNEETCLWEVPSETV